MAEVGVRMALPAPHTERMSLLLARLAAVVVAFFGGLILFVWQLPITRLTEAFPGFASMPPAAAGGMTAAAILSARFTRSSASR